MANGAEKVTGKGVGVDNVVVISSNGEVSSEVPDKRAASPL